MLVVDDEAGVRASLAGILGDEGYAVDAVDSGEGALAVLESRRYDLVLLDVWLPGADGLEVLGRIREADAELPVVVISGHGTIETAVKAVRLGAQDFVEKPLSLEKTLLAVRNALQRRRLETEVRTLKQQLDARYVMVGESPALRRLRAEIAQAAPTSGRALIFGENGTGKELVARAIHAGSLRASGPFVEVYCAAIPEELIESDLFGHVKGAFTGAFAARKGKFELADGGTLFLDEIGDMSLKTQAKILRILQEQKFERVGGNKTISVNVRVLAATNKNLEEEIEKGNFQADLFWRLNVVPIQVPLLRDRLEDIPLLVQDLLSKLAAGGMGQKEFSDGAYQALMTHSWPGNVRELRNFIERIVIMCPNPVISEKEIHLFLTPGTTSVAPHDQTGLLPYLATDFQEAKKSFERYYLQLKLNENEGNISQTAEQIGMDRSHLHKKLKSLYIIAEG